MIGNKFFCLVLLIGQVCSQTIDLRTGVRVSHAWMETGFVNVNDADWVSVDSVGENYSHPIILTSLPDLGGNTYNNGLAVATRIRNVMNNGGKVSFQVKLFQPNDSYCSKSWYTPQYIFPSVEIGWTIAEYGAYNVSSKYIFIIGEGLANRTSPTLGFNYTYEFHQLDYPTGCGEFLNVTCRFPQSYPLEELGAIATIQTLVHEEYLLLRIQTLVRRYLKIVITPHDSMDPSYYARFQEPETVGFMAFRAGITLDCVEGMAIETQRWDSVTSTKLYFPYQLNYLMTPGVFGLLVTHNSLVDSTALRVFSRSSSGAFVITQEDTCDEADPIHTTPESASVIVVGETTNGVEVCDVISSSIRIPSTTDSPTTVPTLSPSGGVTENCRNKSYPSTSCCSGEITLDPTMTSIEDYAFSGCSGLTGSLVIPNSVTSIGSHAFSGCSGFTGSLVIPDSVTTIRNNAFTSCYRFTGSLVIPDSVTTIGEGAFYYCFGFTGPLVIPDSVTTIGEGAFYSCYGFTGSLVIPNSVTSIGDSTFANSYGLTGPLVIPNSVTTIGNGAFTGCYGLTGPLAIPNSVTTIGDGAFAGCYGFTGSLVIPNSVTTIGYSAFDDCHGFTGSLVIPNSVTTIEDYAFYNCYGFTGSLVIPNSVTTIEDFAFYNCSGFTNANTYPNSIAALGSDAFSGNRCNWLSCCEGCTLDEIGLCECDSACNGVCVDSTDSPSLSPSLAPTPYLTPPPPPANHNCNPNPTKSLIRVAELSLMVVGLFGFGYYIKDTHHHRNPRESPNTETKANPSSASSSSSSSRSRSVIEDEAMKQMKQRANKGE